jgi:hypothetical protein
MDSTTTPDSSIVARYLIQVPIPHGMSIGWEPAVEHSEMQRTYNPDMGNKAIVNILITTSGNPLRPSYQIVPTLVYGQEQAGDVCVTVERGVRPVGAALLVPPVTYAKDGIYYTINHEYLPI